MFWEIFKIMDISIFFSVPESFPDFDGPPLFMAKVVSG